MTRPKISLLALILPLILASGCAKKEILPPVSAPRLEGPAAVARPGQTISGVDSRQVVAAALDQVGIRYAYGGDSPREGFDCSGLTSYVFARNGILLPRTAADQYQVGRKVSRAGLKTADLVFFHDPQWKNKVTHVGIYIGGDKMVHAPKGSRSVGVVELKTKYWTQHFIGARRIID